MVKCGWWRLYRNCLIVVQLRCHYKKCWRPHKKYRKCIWSKLYYYLGVVIRYFSHQSGSDNVPHYLQQDSTPKLGFNAIFAIILQSILICFLSVYKCLHISRTFNDNKKMMHQQIINRNKMSFVDSNATTPFFNINKLLKFKILSSYLWKLCCFIHHIYTQGTAIKNAYERQNYKSYSIFLTI